MKPSENLLSVFQPRNSINMPQGSQEYLGYESWAGGPLGNTLQPFRSGMPVHCSVLFLIQCPKEHILLDGFFQLSWDCMAEANPTLASPAVMPVTPNPSMNQHYRRARCGSRINCRGDFTSATRQSRFLLLGICVLCSLILGTKFPQGLTILSSHSQKSMEA